MSSPAYDAIESTEVALDPGGEDDDHGYRSQLRRKRVPTVVPVDPQSPGRDARVERTIVVLDIADSVRLMEADEENVVRRWQALVDLILSSVVPRHAGRLVKSTGDGLLLEFSRVHSAVAAALEIQRASQVANEGLPPDRAMRLRIGIHNGEVYPHQLDDRARDVYGNVVNLAARLEGIAGPGEIVASANVHDQLVAAVDADIEDLGEVRLKNFSERVRAYRIGPPGPRPVIGPGTSILLELVPTIAVIPFSARNSGREHEVVGDLLADEIIASLSRDADLRVISRLSTTAFKDRNASHRDVSLHLNAGYVLMGAYRVSGDQVTLTAELAELGSSRIIWAQSMKGSVQGLVSGRDDLVDRVVTEVGASILEREIERAQALALPTLDSYTLLMGAIVLMHRGASYDFERAGKMLEALTERAGRQAIPHAWLAKWHVLRFNRNWSNDPGKEAQIALDCTKRALDADPNCSLALAMDGFIHTNLLKRLDVGAKRYDLALQVNPNDSLAWLLKGTLHAFKGDGEVAVVSTERALRLSPLDPLRYFYDSLAATAALSAGKYERAIELARRSLRANRVHTSTLRALAISQTLAGRLAEARETVSDLLEREPTLTVTRYLERSPSGDYETGRIWSNALRQAGVPG